MIISMSGKGCQEGILLEYKDDNVQMDLYDSHGLEKQHCNTLYENPTMLRGCQGASRFI